MSIGLKLKKEREARGLTLKDASSKTRIQEKFLDALEKDDLALLPNPVYVKGFLKKYAEFLGLDIKPLVEEFENGAPPKIEQVIAIENKEPPPVDSEKYVKKIFIGIIAFFVTVGIIFFLFSALYKYFTGIKKTRVVSQQKKVKSQAPVLNIQKKKPSQKANVAKPVLKNKPIAQKPLPKVEEPIVAAAPVSPSQIISLNLVVSVRKNCRLSIKADDKLLFEDFLIAGRSEQWQAKQAFQLSVSDASAIELRLNGKKIRLTGRGARNNILITKDGIKNRF